MLPDNLGYLFDSGLALTPSKAAVLQGDTVLTFAELDARANRMANVLAGLGVGAGDRVALLFNNDFRFLETLFGAMRLGAVAVPLNIRMGDEALRYVAEDSEAHVLVASAALAERGRALASRIPAIKELIADGPAAEDVLAYEPALAAASPTLPRRATAFDEVCMQPYTSGSTGKPKGVLLTHGGQIWNSDIMRKALLADDTERGQRVGHPVGARVQLGVGEDRIALEHRGLGRTEGERGVEQVTEVVGQHASRPIVPRRDRSRQGAGLVLHYGPHITPGGT